MGNKLVRISAARSGPTFVGDINLRETGDTLNRSHDGDKDKSGRSTKSGRSSVTKTGSSGALSVDHDNYFTPDERKQFEGSCALSKPKFQDPIHWKRGELLGSGAFGRVFLGLHTRTGELMAAKQIVLTVKGEESDQCLRALDNEIKLMRKLEHKNIVRYWGTERTDKNFTIFMEYIPGGSISSLLKKFGSFNETLVRVYTKQILEGLHYLHSHRIMHRDIKGGNILVDRGGVCKLSDFGASKHLSELTQATAGFQSLRGTPYWMAPEVVRQSGAGRQADIWSVGCTIIEMATGKPPFSHFETPVSALFHIAVAPEPPTFPDILSDTAHDFLRLCFMKDPADRPNAITLLRHPFITSSFLAAPSMRAVRSSYDITDAPPAAVASSDEEGDGDGDSGQRGLPGRDDPHQHSQRSILSVSSYHSTSSARSRTTPRVRKVFPFTSDAASVRSSGTAPATTSAPKRGSHAQARSQSHREDHRRHTRGGVRTSAVVTTNQQRLVFSGAQASQRTAPGGGSVAGKANGNGNGNAQEQPSASPFIWRKASSGSNTSPRPAAGQATGFTATHTATSPRSVGPQSAQSVGRQSSQGVSSAEASMGSHTSVFSNRSDRRRHFSDADWHRTVGEANSAAYESYRSYVEGPNPYSTPGTARNSVMGAASPGRADHGLTSPQPASEALETELRRLSKKQGGPYSSGGTHRSPSPGSSHIDDDTTSVPRRPPPSSRSSRRSVRARRRADGEAVYEDRDHGALRVYETERHDRHVSLRERGRHLSTSTYHSHHSHHSSDRDWDNDSDDEYHTPRGSRRRGPTDSYESRFSDDRYRRDGYYSQPQRRRRESPYDMDGDEFETDRDRDRRYRDRDRDYGRGDAYYDFRDRDVVSEGGSRRPRRHMSHDHYEYDRDRDYDRDYDRRGRRSVIERRDDERRYHAMQPRSPSVGYPRRPPSHGRSSVASHHSHRSRRSVPTSPAPPRLERDDSEPSRQARWEADLAIASEVAVNLLPPPSAETIHSARERSKAQRRLAVGTAAGPNTAGTTEVAAPLPGNAIGQPAP